MNKSSLSSSLSSPRLGDRSLGVLKKLLFANCEQQRHNDNSNSLSPVDKKQQIVTTFNNNNIDTNINEMAGNNKHNRRKSRTSIASTATPNVTPTKVTKQRDALEGDKYKDWVEQIKKLERERDALRKQVLNLANFNYAREPEFVRDRLKLREVTEEVAKMVRQTTGRNLEPILEKLSTIQEQLVQDARNCEELSESMAQHFLSSGSAAQPIASAPPASDAGDFRTHDYEDHENEHNHDAGDDESTVHVDDVKQQQQRQHGRDNASAYDEFLHHYINLRKKASKKRILADRLTKERDSLANNILFKSLISASSNTSDHSNSNNPTDAVTTVTSTTSCTRASSRCSHKSSRSSCSSSRRDDVNCVIDSNNNVDTSSPSPTS